MKRIEFINKYLDDKTIILDRINTYPKNILKLIDDNKFLIKNYIENENLKYNPYYHNFYNLLIDIENYLCVNEFYIISYHATNLLYEEFRDITKNGLKMFDKDSYINKIRNLDKYGFTLDEINIIINNSKLFKNDHINNNRLNLISYFHSIDSLIETNDYVPFMKYWGGEITNMSLEKLPEHIKNKFYKLGKPYLIISKLKITDIPLFKDKLKIVCINYYNNQDNIIEADTTISVAGNLLDIIEIDKEYKTFKL